MFFEKEIKLEVTSENAQQIAITMFKKLSSELNELNNNPNLRRDFEGYQKKYKTVMAQYSKQFEAYSYSGLDLITKKLKIFLENTEKTLSSHNYNEEDLGYFSSKRLCCSLLVGISEKILQNKTTEAQNTKELNPDIKQSKTDKACDVFTDFIRNLSPLAREILEKMEKENTDQFNPVERIQPKTIAKTDKSLNV